MEAFLESVRIPVTFPGNLFILGERLFNGRFSQKHDTFTASRPARRAADRIRYSTSSVPVYIMFTIHSNTSPTVITIHIPVGASPQI